MTDYEIELPEPSFSTCDCCGGLTVRLTRFVYRAGSAFAVYYATYSNNHPDDEISIIISVGDWGEGCHPSERAAFYCHVRPTKESYEVMLGNAASSPWRDVEIIGKKLSREEALRHPDKVTAFDVLDAAFVQDYSIAGFLHRATCGDVAAPLEYSFVMPDDVATLHDDEKIRAKVGGSFVCLDNRRFFIRCLLPIPVEAYEKWCVGLWVEISKSDYDVVQDAWDNPSTYSKMRFSGTIANDGSAKLGLPIVAGFEVELHVPNPDAAPMIVATTNAELAALLSTNWPKIHFEEFAVSRGFL